MKYIADLEFETDEQKLNEFYNSLYLDSEKTLANFRQSKIYADLYSLTDLEQMLSQKGYPQVEGAKEVLEKFIHIKKMILCSGMEHKGSAF